MLINVQNASHTVTGAGGDEIPEQYLVYTVGEEPEIELLNRSSADGGSPIMTETDVARLVDALTLVHAATIESAGSGDPAVNGDHVAHAADVEFAVTAIDACDHPADAALPHSLHGRTQRRLEGPSQPTGTRGAGGASTNPPVANGPSSGGRSRPSGDRHVDQPTPCAPDVTRLVVRPSAPPGSVASTVITQRPKTRTASASNEWAAASRCAFVVGPSCTTSEVSGALSMHDWAWSWKSKPN